jgi:TetR/AcrR family transcriptional repressor of mexJK operon
MMKRKRVIDPEKSSVILQAATRLFLKRGYLATTMDAVAHKAGLTKQTVYAYYGSKDELFKQMLLILCRRYEQSQPPVFGKEPFEAQLLKQGMAILNLITHPDVMATTRLVISESERHPKLAKLYYESGTQKLVQMIAHFLDEYNRRGEIAIANTPSAASYFLAILKGNYYVRMILRVKPEPSEVMKALHVNEAVRIFLAVYTGRHAMATKSVL